MNEHEATQLLERLGGMVDVSGAPVERLVDSGRRATRRRRRWQVGGAAASVAAVAVAGGLVAQLSPQNNASPPTSPTTSPTTTDENSGVLTTPTGNRLVGANGIVVSVPSAFTTNDIVCASTGSDTVTFNNDGPWAACAGGDANATVVDIVDQTSTQWQSRLGLGGDETTVDGATAFRVPLDCPVSSGRHQPPQRCTASLTFPDLGVSFLVKSLQGQEADRILESAQVVPDGYATIPDVSGMPSGEATSAIEAVGLTVDPPCEVPECVVSVFGTDPPAGTPLATGSAVALVPDGRYPGRVPSEDDLLGDWRVSQLGVEHFSTVERSHGEPLLLTFDHLYPWLGWRGYDGCNWTSGRVHLEPNGSFSTSQNATTARGCIGLPDRHPTIPEIVEGAGIVTFDHHHLRFYDSQTRLLATFVRAR